MNIEITRANANSNAQKIMSDDFIFDVTDEFAPFGNDVGNDTFYLYKDWKNLNKDKSAIEFLNKNISEIGLSNFDLKTDTKNAKKLLLTVDKMPNKYEDINFIDNTIISLAFSQLFLTGKIEPQIHTLGKIAIERELLFAGVWEENEKTRTEKLNKLLKVLNNAE
jgi:uncharacterized protein YfeS